jgi:hypothetical protein
MTMSTVQPTTTTGATATTYPAPSSSDGAAGATPSSLLPDPIVTLLSSGDIGAEVAARAGKSGMSERALAREQRQAALARADSQTAQEIQAIHSEASSLRIQAWVDAGAALGAKFVGKDSKGGALILAGKSLADGYFAAGQKDDEANAKAAEAASTDAKGAANDAHETVSGANDFIKAAIDFYQEYASTRAQTLLVAAHRA